MDGQDRSISIGIAQFAVRWLETEGTRGANNREREDRLEAVGRVC